MTAVLARLGGVLVGAAAVLAAADAAAADDPAPGRVSVVFVEPARFTDARDAAQPSERGTAALLAELARFIRQAGERELPAGLSLEVRVTDLDLAGEFEPWRGPQFERFRVLKDVYAPRIDLEFRVTDTDGRVVGEGRRSLRDADYLARSIRVSGDRLRYEKDLLRDWLRQELRP